MEKRRICYFAGHSDISGERGLFEQVVKTITTLIEEEGVTEFWVGNYGGFDRLSAKAVREVKKSHPEIELNLIIPYLTKEINEYCKEYQKNFDNIIVADIPENTPEKFKILKTNQYAVNNSDYLVCFVRYPFGGAAKTLDFAKRVKEIKIINVLEK